MDSVTSKGVITHEGVIQLMPDGTLCFKDYVTTGMTFTELRDDIVRRLRAALHASDQSDTVTFTPVP